MKTVQFFRLAVSIAATLLMTFAVSAQREKTIAVDGDGEFHIRSSMKFGDHSLDKGMYRVYAVFVNADHFLVFQKISMNDGYWKTMGTMKPGKAVRSRYTIEAVGAVYRNTRILLRRNAENQWEAVEVWFRGERERHRLSRG